jgi:hypothetical protein
VLVETTGEPKLDRSVLLDLQQLAEAGTVRLLDAMVLRPADGGARDDG